MTARATQKAVLRRVYGFDFPDDLFEFWRFASRKGVLETLSEQVGMRLCGPFTVLGGGKLPADRDRFEADPPELYTVATGDSDGEHWGYVLHEPGSAGYIGHFHSRDGYPVVPAGASLFDALRDHLDAVMAGRTAELAAIRAVGETDTGLARGLKQMAALQAALARRPRTRLRLPRIAAATLDGLGVVCPARLWAPLGVPGHKLASALRQPARLATWLRKAEAFIQAGKPGPALQIARDAFAVLPVRKQAPAVRVLAAAYHALGRPALAAAVAPGLTPPKPRPTGSRFCRSLEEALEDPGSVHGLLLESWGAQGKLPSLAPIAQLVNLRSLILRGYRLGDLPASLRALRHLERVELFECGLVRFPAVLLAYRRLTQLTIMNGLGAAPRRRVVIPPGARLPRLEALSLVACGLREVPPLVLSARRLYKLSLDNNFLNDLPAGLGKLRALRYLSVSRNALTSLPDALGDLPKLDSLWLSRNRLTALPEALSAVPLTALDLGGNPLAKDRTERARSKQLARKAKIHWA